MGSRASYIVLVFALFVSTTSVIAQTLKLNEVMSLNNTVYPNAENKFYDWVELVNLSEDAVLMSDFSLSDDMEESWGFPDTTIQPGEFIIIYCSGDDENEIKSELHADFKISSSGEFLYLNQADTIIDMVELPALDEDQVYGRESDGEGFWRIQTPTPAASNMTSVALNHLFFSKESGFYEESIALVISDFNQNDTVLYTLDGSSPKFGASTTLIYSGPIIIESREGHENFYSMIQTSPDNGNFPWNEPSDQINKGTVVRAISYRGGNYNSELKEAVYFVNKNNEFDYSIPVVSLIVDSLDLFDFNTGILIPGVHYEESVLKSGNYFQKGRDWEKDVYFEFFDSSGALQLAQSAGLRIHGNLSRTYPQKSFRLYARDDYGDEDFDYPFFSSRDQSQYERLIVRNSYSGHGVAFRDMLVHELVKDENLDVMAGEPAVLYLNGEYWGIFDIRERPGKYYYQNKHGANKDSVDHIFGWGVVLDGSNAEHEEMKQFIIQNDMSHDENYSQVLDLIDMDNYITYMVTEIYLSNADWPANNIELWKEKGSGHKWRWQLVDLDASMKIERLDVNSLAHATGEPSTNFNVKWSIEIFNALLASDQFKNEFISKFLKMVDTTFDPERVLSYIDKYEKIYMKEIDAHIERWGNPVSVSNFQEKIDGMREFALSRPCVAKSHLLEFFDIDTMTITCDPTAVTVEEIAISPNPTFGGFNLKYYSEYSQSARIEIISTTGVVNYEESINLHNGINTIDLSISDSKPGLYLLRFLVDDRLHSARIYRAE